MSQENAPTAAPKIQLITSVRIYVTALGKTNELHRHSFAFVREQSDDQLPLMVLEPSTNISQMVLQTNVGGPTKAVVNTHYAQENPSVLMPSTTAGVNHDVANACMILIVWALYFILEGTPRKLLTRWSCW
jgi:hypothetical protein